MRREIQGCLLAAAVFMGLLPAGPSAADPAVEEEGGARGGRPVRTVTLVTGDRVQVSADGTQQFSVRPGTGREQIPFVTFRVGHRLRVVPHDALPLVRSGRIDIRLFDVTALVEFGYDDRSDLPLIVTYTSRGQARAKVGADVGSAGATVSRELPGVRGLAVRTGHGDAGRLWRSVTRSAAPDRADARSLDPEIDRIWLDGLRTPSLDTSVPQVGAPAAWRAGFTGAAVPVAVLDTGIDATHPDLAGRVVEARNFTEGEDGLDRVGHGTHVASTIAGSGAASGGRYKGVAPDAKLYDGKVCEAYGCSESAILAGMQWAAAEKRVRVVNLSLGGPDLPGTDPLEEAVNTLTARYGTLFVVAAGNSGQLGDYTVNSPGSAEAALTVGAVTGSDELAEFSSRGPRIGDNAVKPDLTAPGVEITAARSKDAAVGAPGEKYVTASGTSMATPHVAGAAAILAQQHPEYSPAQLKATLMGSANPSPTIGVYAQGAGRLDVARAITQTTTAAPPSVSFGLQQWPHSDDEPITRQVRYHNSGPAPVTLTLRLDVRGPDGAPAPAAMFTLRAATVTVPAGGDAEVAVTVDTRVGADGFSGGGLIATGGGQRVQTPVAVVREVESYDLTVSHRDRRGGVADRYATLLIRLDSEAFAFVHDPSGTATLRLPKGRYLLATLVTEGDGDSPELSDLVQPSIDLDRATSVAMDARLARPVSVTVPRPSAASLLADITLTARTSYGHTAVGLLAPGFDGVYTAQIGGERSVESVVTSVTSQWGQPRGDGTFTDSPYAYLLAWYVPGRMVTGFHRRVAARDLAAVRVDTALGATGGHGTKLAFSRLPGWPVAGVSAGFDSGLPFRRTEYHNSDRGAQWRSLFYEEVPGAGDGAELVSVSESAWTGYRAGRRYRETWNQGVHGPTFPATSLPEQWVTRTGNRIHVEVPMYGDGAGRAGYARPDTARTRLQRDGVTVGETELPGYGDFDVAPDDARYRLEVDTTRGAPFTTSTRTTATWSFQSRRAGDSPTALPLSAIRFTPELDLNNRAEGGPGFEIPIRVQRQPGAAAGRIAELTVEVSFDDGATWRKAAVAKRSYGGVAKVDHPAGGGFVSLRGTAGDAAGGTVELTIIRAYRY